MITFSQIRNGSGYMHNHLSSNDYYSENERVVGRWRGEAAKMLGLEGHEVTAEAFEALRSNRHPATGDKLTPRRPKVAFHDFVVSAPKSVSVMALVGGDDRIVEAFDRCVAKAFDRLSEHAAVRVRGGQAYNTEQTRKTGNTVAAVFRHDTSRLLDPQLHTHLVFANMTWDERSGRWLALQPKEMGVQSKETVRGHFYSELEKECRALGYETERHGEGFRLKAVTPELEAAFSQRSREKREFESRYCEMFGEAPTKERVEQFIKEGKAAATRRFIDEYRRMFGGAPSVVQTDAFVQDWRSAKMARASREEVRVLQRECVSEVDLRQLRCAVDDAYKVAAGYAGESLGESTSDTRKVQEGEIEMNRPDSCVPKADTKVEKSAANTSNGSEHGSGIERRNAERAKLLRAAKSALVFGYRSPVKLMTRRLQELSRKGAKMRW